MRDLIQELSSFALEMCVALAGPMGVILVLVAFTFGLFMPKVMPKLTPLILVCALVSSFIFGFLFTATSAGPGGQPQFHIAGWHYAEPAKLLIEREKWDQLPRAERDRQLLDLAGDDEALVWTASSLDFARGFALFTAVLVSMVIGLLFGSLFNKKKE
ncbi:hypothetical protein [Roseibium sp. SCP14]|uniref:hypothetical protein n=1 Tax=Roseibium sp. SCP14 TaxID=3141375 RepID=UPI00333CFBB7